MHQPQIAAMAADAPGSAGRQCVQTTSYFRKAMKAALHSTVAVVCAGSIAVNAVASPPAPAPAPSPYVNTEVTPADDDPPNPPDPETGRRHPGNGIADSLHSGSTYRHQITLDYPGMCPGASTSSDPTYMTCPADQTFPDTGLYSELRKAAIEGNLGILKKFLDDAREEGRRETIDINNPPDTPWLLSQANVQDVVTQFLKEVWRGGLFLVFFNAQRPISYTTATRWGQADGLLAPYAVGTIGVALLGYIYHVVFAQLVIKEAAELRRLQATGKLDTAKFNKKKEMAGMKARFAALFVAATCTALIDLLYTMALRSAVEKMNRPGRRLQGNEDNLLAGVKAELDKIIEGLVIQDDGYRGFINIKASKYCEATTWTTPFFAEPLPAYGKVKVHGARFIKDPSDRVFGGRWVTKQYEYTPSLLLHHFPKKIVGDGEKIWMLAKKEQNGFSIWRRAQRDELRNQLNIVESHNWQHIDGQLTDIYPGPTHVWGVNKNGHVFACRQTCDGRWDGVAAPFVARSVAVGAAGRPVHTRGEPKWTTIGGKVMVWVKDKDGKIWMKPENPNAAFPGWALTQNVPPRITELLNERYPMSDFGVPDDLRLPYAWGVH